MSMHTDHRDHEPKEGETSEANVEVLPLGDTSVAQAQEGEVQAREKVEQTSCEPLMTPVPLEASQENFDKVIKQLALYRGELGKVRQQLREKEIEAENEKTLRLDAVTKLKDEHDAHLRAAANLENFRRRSAKDREDMAKYGQEKLIKALLPVMDNLELALDPKNSRDPEALRKGVEMTLKMFEKNLGDMGVKGISAIGQKFDPQLHEALQAVETDGEPGIVINALGRAYLLNDRLIRPAVVFVSKAREDSEEAASAESEENRDSSSTDGDESSVSSEISSSED